MQLANVLCELGKIEEALEASRKCARIIWRIALACLYFLCFALVAAGHFEKAEKVANDLENKAAQIYVPPYFLAMTHLALGKTDSAFEYFRQAFEEKMRGCVWFKTEPKLDSDSRTG